MAFLVHDGSVLLDTGFETANVMVSSGGLALEPHDVGARLRFDARDLLVLPGMVDIHGDAFERQIMPRPGVSFPIDLALLDTDRQLIANGITTACLGITYSWEPGLRGRDNAASLLDAVRQLKPRTLADLKIHLRHETFYLDGEEQVLRWIEDGRLSVLAFNDHMEGIVKTTSSKHAKLVKMVERSGLTEAEFTALVDRVWQQRDEVAGSVARLAKAAVEAGIVLMSHDDRSPEERRHYRHLGCTIAEFPMTEATAREAIEAHEATVFGAPNVVRGGSHTGCPAAEDMASKGLLTILASDYYYPAMAQAPYLLDRKGVMPLADAWAMVSKGPAEALGLTDRGRIADGLRADLVLASPSPEGMRLVATFALGKLVFCTEPHRIRGN